MPNQSLRSIIANYGYEINNGKLIYKPTGKEATSKEKVVLKNNVCQVHNILMQDYDNEMNQLLQTAAQVNTSNLEKGILDVYRMRRIHWNDVDKELWCKYFSAYRGDNGNTLVFCHDPKKTSVTALAKFKLGDVEKNANSDFSLNLEVEVAGSSILGMIEAELGEMEDWINNDLLKNNTIKDEDELLENIYANYPASILESSARIEYVRNSDDKRFLEVRFKGTGLNTGYFSVPKHISLIMAKIAKNTMIADQPYFWSTDPSVPALNFTNISDVMNSTVTEEEIKDWLGVEAKIIAGTGADIITSWRHAFVSIFDFRHSGRQAIFLTGVGHIGKSAIANAISGAFGPAACSEEPESLNNHFNMNTFGKRLVYVGDCKDSINVTKSQKFQRMTGGDTARFEGKGVDAISWRHASQKLLFTMNAVPLVNLNDTAEISRVLVYRMDIPENADEAIIEKDGYRKGDPGYSERLENTIWKYYKFCRDYLHSIGMSDTDILAAVQMPQCMRDVFEPDGNESQMLMTRFIEEFLVIDEDSMEGVSPTELREVYTKYYAQVQATDSKLFMKWDKFKPFLNNYLGGINAKLATNGRANCKDINGRFKGWRGLTFNDDEVRNLKVESVKTFLNKNKERPHTYRPSNSSEDSDEA